VCLIEGQGRATSDDTSVHIFRARDWDDAFARALTLGHGHEKEYANEAGERVRWRLDRVETIDMIRQTDLDGVEVYSTMSEVSDGPAFDTKFEPEKYQPGNTGI
jgi:Domain of unknown function (DUF4288)